MKKNSLEIFRQELNVTAEDLETWERVNKFKGAELFEQILIYLAEGEVLTKKEFNWCFNHCKEIINTYEANIDLDNEQDDIMENTILDFMRGN